MMPSILDPKEAIALLVFVLVAKVLFRGDIRTATLFSATSGAGSGVVSRLESL